MGKEKAIATIIKKADALKIPIDRIEANYGKKESWDVDKIVAVMGAVRIVEDGIESMEVIFSDKVSTNGEPEIIGKEKEGVGSWVKKINTMTTEKKLDEFEKTYNIELQELNEKDAEIVRDAFLDKRAELKKKKG